MLSVGFPCGDGVPFSKRNVGEGFSAFICNQNKVPIVEEPVMASSASVNQTVAVIVPAWEILFGVPIVGVARLYSVAFASCLEE